MIVKVIEEIVDTITILLCLKNYNHNNIVSLI